MNHAHLTRALRAIPIIILLLTAGPAYGQFSDQQLARWLKRFPQADADGDGKLTLAEAQAYRQKLQRSRKPGQGGRGAPRQFSVDPGWQADRFPEHAVCYRSPAEIAKVYADVLGGKKNPITSYPKPRGGALRIVGTGHSFMAPGYKTFPKIVAAAGLRQPPLLTHTGGGMTGSARYKWEQENGIFQFDRKPTPKLLASIANAQWDAMMWGPYFNDKPSYYACWIDFCLKYNPHMKFYLSDAWPQLGQLDELPKSEDELTKELFVRLGQEKNATHKQLLDTLEKKYPGKVFIMPTSDAMVLAVSYYREGKLPGVEGVHTAIGNKERSLWRDRLGHLGPGLGQLEGYVFYATIYGRSPEQLKDHISFDGAKSYPSSQLDQVFRKIAWQAVVQNPLSGVTDRDQNGIDDDRQS